QTAVPAKSALQQQNVAAGHEGSVGDVIIRTALNREIAGGRSAYEETDDVTHLVEAAFGNCNERAGKREALGDEHQRLHTLVRGSARTPAGSAIGRPRASSPSFP